MIFLASDHRGFALKEQIKIWLASSVHKVIDCGAHTLSPDDDYVDYAKKVAKAMQKKPGSFGILICGTGGGMVITANKFAGIRAVQAWNEAMAKKMRSDDNANVLALGADYCKIADVKKIVDIFLHTKFVGDKKYQRRLRKIEAIEVQYKGY